MAVRGLVSDIVENWSSGVITALLSDRLPDGAISSAKNSQFLDIGLNAAVMGTRYGCDVAFDGTAVNEPIISQYFLNTDSNDYHLVTLGTSGDLAKLSAGALTTLESGAFVELNDFISWATFGNWAFAANGTDQIKTNGSDVEKFGIAQPNDAHWSVSAGGAGGVLPTGDYDLVITYYNSSTNHEGPTSEVKTVTGVTAGQKLTVTLPTALQIDDAQVDFIKIYIRQRSTRQEPYLVIAGTTPAITSTSGWSVGTASVEIDSTQTQLLAFRILAPFANDNYPPPADTKILAVHKSRVFAFTNTEMYWSDIGFPEKFNRINNKIPIGIDDGEAITAALAFGDALIIWTKRAVYYLDGDDPQTWEVRLIDNTVGCVGQRTVGVIEGVLAWVAENGPHIMTSVGNIQDITTEVIGPNFGETFIHPDDLSNAVVILHPRQNYVAWAVTPVGETTNSRIIPYNTKLRAWMATEWTMVDVRSCATVQDTNGREWPYIGDYNGNIYQVGTDTPDGVPGGENPQGVILKIAGTDITTGTPSTIEWPSFLPDPAAWDDNVLRGRYLYVWNPDEGLDSVQHRRITANTATSISVDSVFDVTPEPNWRYVVGGIFLDWRSPFRNGGGPFFKKRIEFLFGQFDVSSEGETIEILVYRDGDETTPIMHRSITVGSSDQWDEALWDSAQFAAATIIHKRLPIRAQGFSWQERILHMSTSARVTIRRLGVQWLTKTKKVSREQ